VLLIILIALFGGGMAMGGMAMMAGMMSTAIGWIALIIIGLLALGAYLYFLREFDPPYRRQPISDRAIQNKLQKSKGVLKMAIDPVCKMEIDEKSAVATSEYKGKTYYFCAPGCKTAFDKEPEKYLGDREGHESHSHH